MKKSKSKNVYICHCVDAEGPMKETIEATWDRIFREDGLELQCAPSKKNLQKLQNKMLKDPNLPENLKDFLAHKYSQKNLTYLKSWSEIDQAVKKVISKEFRMKCKDSTEQPYRFNWFIYDHYGFSNNPRFHAEGIHTIWDHYHKLFLNENTFGDGIYWHYHHVPPSRDATEWHMNWNTNGIHEEILSRRIIERSWFPSIFRAGGHIERNELSYWLDLFIPFDFSCRTPKNMVKKRGRGSENDWRGAPMTWGFYHPHFYDYRKPGIMSRAIFRCLDLRTWITALTYEDVKEAFEQANLGYNTVLAFYNHDYRDMEQDILFAMEIIKECKRAFPDVQWRHSNCLEAARYMMGYSEKEDKAPIFNYNIEGELLTIASDQDLFGPEPFLAIQENNYFFRDSTTCETPRKWCYRFRRFDEVKAFGIAGNSPGGKTGLVIHRF